MVSTCCFVGSCQTVFQEWPYHSAFLSINIFICPFCDTQIHLRYAPKGLLGIYASLPFPGASLVASQGRICGKTVKNPPAVWETYVRSLGWGDPLEKGTATHSSILAWRIPWTEEPRGLQSTRKEIRPGWGNFHFTHLFPTQGLNPDPPHCRQILCHPSHQASPTFARNQIVFKSACTNVFFSIYKFCLLLVLDDTE